MRPEERNYLRTLILRFFPESEILIFGSRASGTHRETSDLDICIRNPTPLDLGRWALLEEAISNSDLLYKIDLVDWNRISPEFKAIIQPQLKLL